MINSWLGGLDSNIARSDYRPTEIELAFLKEVNVNSYNLEINPNDEFPKKYLLNRFLSPQDFTLRNGTYRPTSLKSKAVSAALKSLNSGAVGHILSD